MKILRIEHLTLGHGMWYNDHAVRTDYIRTLTEGISKHLPMDFDERYKADDRAWFSGCFHEGQLRQWFTKKDVEELIERGFQMFQFDSEQYQIEEHQALFTREGIVSTKVMSIEDLYLPEKVTM